MPDDYTTDLVKLEDYRIDSSCRDALEAMILACRAAGYTCKINNTYRSKSTQQEMWDRSTFKFMAQGMTYEQAAIEAGKTLALPGHSEHQTGLAVDITGTKAMYKWLAEHCWDYGFIL